MRDQACSTRYSETGILYWFGPPRCESKDPTSSSSVYMSARSDDPSSMVGGSTSAERRPILRSARPHDVAAAIRVARDLRGFAMRP